MAKPGKGPDGNVDGTSGNDVMRPNYVDYQGDQIDGADGLNDTIIGYNGNDTIVGGRGNDVIYGDAPGGLLGKAGKSGTGGAESGRDVLDGGAGADRIYGGGGNDVINVSAIGDGYGDHVDGGTFGILSAGSGKPGTGVFENEDNDTLNITGSTGNGVYARIVNQTTDSDGNGTNGTIQWINANGSVLGSMNFVNIERIIGDFTPPPPPNVAPVARNDAYEAGEDDSAQTVGNVLGNDTDANGDSLSVSRVNGTTGDVGRTVVGSNGGLVTINANGTVSFDPNGQFESLGVGDTMTTSVSYTVRDPSGLESTATATFTVIGANDGPEAVVDTFEVGEDSPAAIIGNVLTNDTDPDGDTLTVSAINGDPALVGTAVPATGGGLVTIGEDGSVSFDPNGEFDALRPGETADVTLTYTAVDPTGVPTTTTVTITVNGANDDPTATDNAYTVSLSEVAGDVDGNVITEDAGDGVDSDPEDTTLTVVAVGGLATGVGTAVAGDNGGLFTINADGSVDFSANGEFDGLSIGESEQTSVTYTIRDEDGGEDTATVTFTVARTNDGIVQGTAGDDVINATLPYVDADGDVVDGNDAILPGDTGDDDVIYGFDGNDSINAGDGNDDVFGGNDEDTIDGGIGDDNLDGGADNDTLLGGEGEDTLDGGTGDDVIEAGADDDTILGSSGDDTIDGGTGRDTYEGPADETMIVNVDDNGDGTVELVGEGTDTVTSVENYIAPESASEEDEITLTTPVLSSEVATAISGLDDAAFGQFTTLSGDVIRFGPPVSVTPGVPAADYLLSDILGGVSPDGVLPAVGPAGSFTIEGGDEGGQIGEISFDNFETINFTVVNDLPGPVDGLETGEEMLPGYVDGQGDQIDGADGVDDTIFGNGGDDTIDSGAGNDVVDGGDGDDTFVLTGGMDQDTLIGGEDGETDGDTLDASDFDTGEDLELVLTAPETGTITEVSTGETTEFSEIEAFILGAGDDTVTGSDGDDNVNSGGGDDFMDGGEGDDTLTSGDGLDTIFGGDGNDSLVGGDEADELYGEDGNDTLIGGLGADTLDGGIDDDLLQGGVGQDDMIGGQGADTMEGGDDRDFFIINERTDAFGDVVDGGTGGNDVDRLTLTGLGRFEIVDQTTDADGDSTSGTVNFIDALGNIEGSLTFTEIEQLVICFTPGTAIATPRGEVDVTNLQVGDRVITRDNGVQEISWIGRKKLGAADLIADPKLRPVLIKKGSLGNGLPERDMMVSPNHRMLMANSQTQILFDEREVLVAAKHMVGQPGVHQIDTLGTEYIHVMFERHEVILGDGTWTESFQPGDHSLSGIDADQRDEIFKLFPSLESSEGRRSYGSARQSLKAHEARMLRQSMGSE